MSKCAYCSNLDLEGHTWICTVEQIGSQFFREKRRKDRKDIYFDCQCFSREPGTDDECDPARSVC
jgi:hypothetical protein